jgi:transcription elongation factor Elf1
MMSDALLEHHFTCPYCWESISMLLDLSVDSQSYVEDCEVCCNPIDIQVAGAQGDLVQFSAEQMD